MPLDELQKLRVEEVHAHKKSTFWSFIIIFLGIISFSILGLHFISEYELREQVRMDAVVSDSEHVDFIPNGLDVEE